MRDPRLLLGLLALAATAAPGAEPLVRYQIDDDRIAKALTRITGDPARGHGIVTGRDANCLLCHAVPDSGGRATGNIGPSLAGVGARLTEGQIRLRIVDPSRLDPHTVMPSYYRVEALNRVAPAHRGRPVLNAQQVEDVIAYLRTLQ